MRSQLERDEVTITIATSLVLVLVTVVLGAAAVVLLAWAVDLPDEAATALFFGVAAASIWTGGSYLWRHRRP